MSFCRMGESSIRSGNNRSQRAARESAFARPAGLARGLLYCRPTPGRPGGPDREAVLLERSLTFFCFSHDSRLVDANSGSSGRRVRAAVRFRAIGASCSRVLLSRSASRRPSGWRFVRVSRAGFPAQVLPQGAWFGECGSGGSRQAHGSIGRVGRGNPPDSERLSRWSKALGFRPSLPPRDQCTLRCGVGGRGGEEKEREGKVDGVRRVPKGNQLVGDVVRVFVRFSGVRADLGATPVPSARSRPGSQERGQPARKSRLNRHDIVAAAGEQSFGGQSGITGRAVSQQSKT